ncbi:MAG: NAD-dependent epimerase [Hyphomicrobiales bacterium]|nr:NAD-dependent epimerase [Hyphomicrobiales bacterium]
MVASSDFEPTPGAHGAKRVLVTGVAGFIGNAVALKLLDQGHSVVGVDSITDYYDVRLKHARLARLNGRNRYAFHQTDICDLAQLADVFQAFRPTHVIHLAAQAGVRYSITNPHVYAQANLVGFTNIIDLSRLHGVEHFVYASTSSVYGANTRMPFSMTQNTDHPLTLYAASKKANELIAHSYSHIFALPTTGLRFFTVYGPWGRPDMMMAIFSEAILQGRPIPLFNAGHMERDFTYIDDIVEGVVRSCWVTATPDPDWTGDAPACASSTAPYRVYNIGNGKPVQVLRVVELLEENLRRKAERNLLPMQPGDVPATFADISELARATGFKPDTPIETGVKAFTDWYKSYRGL